MVRHGTASKRLSQSRYGWTVSDPGLVIELHQTERPHHGGNGPAFFIVDFGASHVGDGLHSIDNLTLGVLRDEILIPKSFYFFGDFFHGPIHGPCLPFIAEGSAVKHLGQSVFIDFRCLEHACALGAQSTFADGMVRISLNIEDFSGFGVGAADQAAGDGTVITKRCGLFGGLDPVHFPDFLDKIPGGLHIDSQTAGQSNAGSDLAGKGQNSRRTTSCTFLLS